MENTDLNMTLAHTSNTSNQTTPIANTVHAENCENLETAMHNIDIEDSPTSKSRTPKNTKDWSSLMIKSDDSLFDEWTRQIERK